MATDPRGAVLATIRQQRGYALDDFARRIRVEPERWQAFEHGTPSVSTAAVTRAALALGLDPDRIDVASDPQLAFSHVGVPDFFHADVDELRASLDRARAFRFVLDVLEHRGKLEMLEPRRPSVPAYADGYALAREVRGLLRNETRPLVDVKELLEHEAGTLVATYRFRAKSVRAVTAKEPGARAVAVVVAEITTDRERLLRRVDLAHELAHVLFDTAQAGTDIWIDTEDSAASPVTTEQRARAFAAELLLPAAALESIFGKASAKLSADGARAKAESLMTAYRASPDVVANHLVNHGYVRDDEREHLASLLAEADVPACVERFETDALLEAVRAAVARGTVTRGRAMELLGRSIHEAEVVLSGISA